MKTNKKGSALIQVMILLVLLAILGTAFLSITTNEYMQSEKSNRDMQAYYRARSGLEAAMRRFERDLPGTFSYTPYFFHGNVSALTLSEPNQIYNGTTGADQDIVTVVTKTLKADGSYDITIRSTGRVQNKSKTVRYIFNYIPGSNTSSPALPSGILNAGANPEDIVEWYHSNNKHIKNNAVTVTQPILIGDSVTQQSNSNTLIAPAMYFTAVPLSLNVAKNHELTLQTNFIALMGDVLGESSGSHQGVLKLTVNGSEVDGVDIKNGSGVVVGIPGRKYGVVYIGRRVRNGITTFIGSQTGPSGYYYFPSGVNLTSTQGVAALIRINDLGQVNMNKLKVTITTGGSSVGTGVYD